MDKHRNPDGTYDGAAVMGEVTGLGRAVSGGRHLQPGDEALTDYNGRGIWTKVRIVERRNSNSQSGVVLRVDPALKNGSKATWYDADWFKPEPSCNSDQ